MSVFRILPAILLAAAFSLSQIPLPGLSVTPAHAAGGSDPAPAAKPVDPNFTEGRKAIDAKNFNAAIPLFQAVVAKDAQNADAYNWLGYAYRNLGNYEQSFAHYTKALEIDPRHRGAHEYIGEAYLKTNQLEKAEEHLKRLDSLCLFGCAEYTELKNKIAAHKAGKPS
jgi:tetratricopeptide (TPR) repeat protein